HVTMPDLTKLAGFANQLWRYASVKLYAIRHGLTPAFPPWSGNDLFNLQDESCAGFDFPVISYPGFATNDRELWDRDDPPINIELLGYFQEIPECWGKHRDLLRHMFAIPSEYAAAIDDWRQRVTEDGLRALVAVHVRRGDYRDHQNSSPQLRFVPEEWYLEWLRAIWPTLRDPVLFVATDEPETILPVFREFNPVAAYRDPRLQSLPDHVLDFEILRRADCLAICNSSFSRMAA